MSKCLALILLLAACACFSRADDVFSARDVQRVKLIVNQQQKKSGLWQDAEETAHAVAALTRIGAEPQNKDKICEELKAQLSKAKSTDAKTVSALVQGLTILKCKVEVTADLKSGIQFSLNSEVLADIHAAVTAVIALRDAQGASLRDWDFSHVATNVAGMAEDDGTYRSSAEGHDASAYYAGLALHVLGLVTKNAPSTEVTETATNAAKKIESLMDSGRSEDVDFAASSKASGVAAATAVLRGLDTLAGSLRGTQIDVSEAQVRRICSFLVDNKYTRNVHDIYHVLEGLQVCVSNNIHIPVVLSVVNATPASLKVRVTNVLDKLACPATVSISQVTAATDNSVLFSNVQLQAGAEAEYQLASADKWNGAAPGYYNVRFAVNPTGDKFKAASLERITRKVKVLADVKPASVAVWVSESAKSSGEGSVQRANYPGVLSTRLTAEKNHYLYADIGLTGPAFQPSQVFIQLSKKGQADQAAVFPAVPKKDDKGHYLVKVHLASTEFQESVFGAGEYDVSVIVGDSLLVTSVKWKVGQAQINVDAAARTDAFADQPEIAHNFRAPEKRPHTVLAMVFTLVILAALAVLLIRLLASGALNLQLPSNPQELIFALGFQASLGAILCLYVLYWLKLNIFQALFVLAVVAAPAIYFGNQALKRRHLRTNAAHEHKE